MRELGLRSQVLESGDQRPANEVDEFLGEEIGFTEEVRRWLRTRNGQVGWQQAGSTNESYSQYTKEVYVVISHRPFQSHPQHADLSTIHNYIHHTLLTNHPIYTSHTPFIPPAAPTRIS